MIASAFIPAFAGASGLLESRSIEMSSSASASTGVTYSLTFTAETGIDGTTTPGGAVIEFCDNNPLIGLACDSTDGSNVKVDSASLSAVNYNGVAASSPGSIAKSHDTHATGAGSDKNVIKWTAGADVSATDVVNLVFTGIQNPTFASASKTAYARVTTYTEAADMSGWTQDDTVGSFADEGGIALGYNGGVGITAYVQESMTFCLSHAAPTANCGGTNSPSLTLGQTVGTGTALLTSAVSTGTDYAQMSTNAANGAVVNLQIDNACGGLKRTLPVSVVTCDIAAQNSNGSTINAGDSKFGLKVGSPVAATGGTASGTLEAAHGSNYDNVNYFLDYVGGGATGVTSTYGSPVIDSGFPAAPVGNENIPFTFGASVSNTTPAGVYAATLHMIATGTF
jgi:hypothetical protein